MAVWVLLSFAAELAWSKARASPSTWRVKTLIFGPGSEIPHLWHSQAGVQELPRWWGADVGPDPSYPRVARPPPSTSSHHCFGLPTGHSSPSVTPGCTLGSLVRFSNALWGNWSGCTVAVKENKQGKMGVFLYRVINGIRWEYFLYYWKLVKLLFFAGSWVLKDCTVCLLSQMIKLKKFKEKNNKKIKQIKIKENERKMKEIW